eukprot:1990184-Amphidinium_carterae.2
MVRGRGGVGYNLFVLGSDVRRCTEHEETRQKPVPVVSFLCSDNMQDKMFRITLRPQKYTWQEALAKKVRQHVRK